MSDEIKRGRTLSLVLLGAVSLIFVVNASYPLYLSPADQSNRFMALFVMLSFVALAYNGVRGMRAVISGVLFVLVLVDGLVLLAALAEHRFAVSVELGCIIVVSLTIACLLFYSKSVRAFEAARQKLPA